MTESLAAVIRRRRRWNGWTQAELAYRVGVSLGMIRDLEQGRTTRPNPGSLATIAKALTDDPASQAEILAFARSGRGRPTPTTAASTAQQNSPDNLRIHLLGPLAVIWLDAPLPLNGDKQRLLFAALAVNANVWVHTRMLVDALWPDARPARAELLVRTYVARLSRLFTSWGLPTEVLSVTRAGMHYRLQASPDSIDLLIFDRLVDEARRAAARAGLATGVERYADALDLWSDDPLVDVNVPRDGPLIDDLRKRRATVTVEFAEACCELGWYAHCLPALERIVHEEPLNEHAQACLILALAGLGQQAPAMALYHEVSRNLRVQLGIPPSPVLEEVYQRILADDLVAPLPFRVVLEAPAIAD